MSDPSTAPATITCPWCAHSETGAGYGPHDRMIEHYPACLARVKKCGCRFDRDLRAVLTCDDHAPAYIRQQTAWRIANYEARRYVTQEALL